MTETVHGEATPDLSGSPRSHKREELIDKFVTICIADKPRQLAIGFKEWVYFNSTETGWYWSPDEQHYKAIRIDSNELIKRMNKVGYNAFAVYDHSLYFNFEPEQKDIRKDMRLMIRRKPETLLAQEPNDRIVSAIADSIQA